jgi:hypothetical protein
MEDGRRAEDGRSGCGAAGAYAGCGVATGGRGGSAGGRARIREDGGSVEDERSGCGAAADAERLRADARGRTCVEGCVDAYTTNIISSREIELCLDRSA